MSVVFAWGWAREAVRSVIGCMQVGRAFWRSMREGGQ